MARGALRREILTSLPYYLPGAMKSPACCKALAFASVLLLSAALAGPDPSAGAPPLEETEATAVTEPSPIFLLASTMAVLLLLMRKGGPR